MSDLSRPPAQALYGFGPKSTERLTLEEASSSATTPATLSFSASLPS
jgi:hypothetical protein